MPVCTPTGALLDYRPAHVELWRSFAVGAGTCSRNLFLPMAQSGHTCRTRQSRHLPSPITAMVSLLTAGTGLRGNSGGCRLSRE